MGLHPLEFSDCLADSPYFRENLHAHEKELERTSKAIKGLITEVKELLNAARNLSKAQRSFSHLLSEFKFESIGINQTDDEIVIAESLKKFGKLISTIEDERDRMLDRAYDQIIHPLETFRKERIGGAKEEKKKFDKQTAKFCASLDRYLNLKAKSNDNVLQEQDALLDCERRDFYNKSMKYVLILQDVQERKKFEFVETLLGFMYGWLTFYHQGHEVAGDFKPYMTDLQIKLQKCRENFDTAHEEAEQLKVKMLEVRGTKPQDQYASRNTGCSREGYLYMMEKKALSTTWTKYYAQYQKENQILTMIPYNQVAGKGSGTFSKQHFQSTKQISTETFVLETCTRRASDTIDKRFCFDIKVQDRLAPITLQALSKDDMQLWFDVMDGREPIYNQPSTKNKEHDSLLDDIGFNFIRKCIHAIEKRGLDDQGLYRVVGVNSKVNKLTTMGLDRRKVDKLNLEEDTGEWEVKTVTSALKNYFRSLPEPLMTYKHHEELIAAAKQESKTLRINDIHCLIHRLPQANFEMLDMLVSHLKKVADNSVVNLMTVSNLGVCFGPTLMRPEEETIAAIMDIKFCNIVVEILINHYKQMFKTAPEGTDITVESKVISQSTSTPVQATRTRPTPPEKKPHLNSMPTSNQSNSVVGGYDPGPPPPSASSTSSSGSASSSAVYANCGNNNSNSQTYAQVRAKLRPTTGIYGMFSPGEHHSSTSSSSESLNSKCSAHNLSNPSINTAGCAQPEPRRATTPVSLYSNLQQATAPLPYTRPRSAIYHYHYNSPFSNGGTPHAGAPLYRVGNRHSQQLPTSASAAAKTDPLVSSYHSGVSYRKRQSADSITFSISSSTSSVSSISSNTASGNTGRKVRTLYSCDAENDSELSFEPNQIILNVRSSREPGWLEGVLEGKRGLVPANYVEYVN